MLKPNASLHQTRSYLYRELRGIYPDGEATSLIRLILEHLGYELSAPVREPDLKPGSRAIAQINKIVSEIHTQRPIQYILGYTHFCELKIHLNEHVLIPRPETEEMVFRIIGQMEDPPERVLDIGTGSGCIALALKNYFPRSDVFGLDASREALNVARENARHTGLSISWIEGDILREFPEEDGMDFDLIVSNPPYVLQSQRTTMQANVLQFEPGHALFVTDKDPLVFYRRIAGFAAVHLGARGSLWVEINEQLGNETARVFKNAGFRNVTVLKDIHEKERFVQVTREPHGI